LWLGAGIVKQRCKYIGFRGLLAERDNLLLEKRGLRFEAIDLAA
jgi:hypothetical protein